MERRDTGLIARCWLFSYLESGVRYTPALQGAIEYVLSLYPTSRMPQNRSARCCLISEQRYASNTNNTVLDSLRAKCGLGQVFMVS
jgi:hypothetical protein